MNLYLIAFLIVGLASPAFCEEDPSSDPPEHSAPAEPAAEEHGEAEAAIKSWTEKLQEFTQNFFQGLKKVAGKITPAFLKKSQDAVKESLDNAAEKLSEAAEKLEAKHEGAEEPKGPEAAAALK